MVIVQRRLYKLAKNAEMKFLTFMIQRKRREYVKM
jgi:hypothetical protein